MINSLLLMYITSATNLRLQTVQPVTPNVVTAPIITAQNATAHVVQNRYTTVAAGSQRVPMTSVSITAPCSANVDLLTLNVQRRGLGSTQDIDSVYIEVSGNRLTRGRALTNRRGEVSFNFTDITIPACQTKQFDVMADIAVSAAASSQHYFEVLGMHASVLVDITRETKAPTYEVRQPTTGTVTANILPLNSAIRYGTNRTVGRMQLTVDGNIDQVVSSIVFTNNGSARNTDVQNMYLYTNQGGKITTTVAVLTEDKVELFFDPPLVLNKNTTTLLQVRADVLASRSRTINLIIEEPSDIRASASRRR